MGENVNRQIREMVNGCFWCFVFLQLYNGKIYLLVNRMHLRILINWRSYLSLKLPYLDKHSVL